MAKIWGLGGGGAEGGPVSNLRVVTWTSLRSFIVGELRTKEIKKKDPFKKGLHLREDVRRGTLLCTGWRNRTLVKVPCMAKNASDVVKFLGGHKKTGFHQEWQNSGGNPGKESPFSSIESKKRDN